MIKKINNTEKIKKSLKRKGKTTVLNKPKHVASVIEMNQELERVHAAFLAKSKNIPDNFPTIAECTKKCNKIFNQIKSKQMQEYKHGFAFGFALAYHWIIDYQNNNFK